MITTVFRILAFGISLTLPQTLTAQQPSRSNVPTPPNGILFEQGIAYRPGSDRWLLNIIHREIDLREKESIKPRAAIVVIHGGGWSTGDHNSFVRRGFNLAKEGYVVITPTYRLINDGPFPACLHDVKNAIRWLRANAKKYNVDPNRIGAYGNSAGATLALTAATTAGKMEGDGTHLDQSSALQAVVCSGAVGDMTHENHSRRAKFVYKALATGNNRKVSDEQAQKVMQQASPATYIHKGMPPMLIIHGAKDTVVHIESTDEFVEKAKKVGATIRYLRYEDGTHGVMGQKSKTTTPEMLKFFDLHLRGEKK